MKFKRGYFYILFSAVIFSTMEIALKKTGGIFAPMQITVLRFLVGGFCLIPFALSSLKKKKAVLGWADWRHFSLLGFLCVVVSMVFYQMAVTRESASVVAVVFCSNSIFVSILAFLALRERIYWNNVLALALIILGILSIMKPWEDALNPDGVLMAIAAAVLFSVYAVMGKRASAKCGGIAVTCFSFICGGAELLVLVLAGKIPAVGELLRNVPALGVFAGVPLFAGITFRALPAFLYICVAVSAGGFVCYMMSMETTSANETALVFFIKPVLAPILAYFIIDETISWNMALGIIFFLAGSLASVIPAMLRSKAPG